MSLTETEKSVLVKGLSLFPPKQLSYLINLELFHTSIDNLKIICRDNLDFIKTRIKNTALTYFRHYNANVPQKLPNEEFEALKTLAANCHLVIQKADKGNPVVIVEKKFMQDLWKRFLVISISLKKLASKKGF